MLIKIKEKELTPIMHLHTLALKHIFDKLSLEEERALDRGIQMWCRIQNLSADDKIELHRIIEALLADEAGYFNGAKAIQRISKIHYTSIYKGGLPYLKNGLPCNRWEYLCQ